MNTNIKGASSISCPKLILSEVAVLAVGMLGGWVARDGFSSYNRLHMPPLAPPSWLFPVVWTILYLLMGFGGYLVAKNGEDAKNTLTFFAVYMVLNFLWPTVFFVHGAFLAAFFLLVTQLILLAVCFFPFYHASPLAGLSLVPTVLWTLFAGYLNFAFFLLNR